MSDQASAATFPSPNYPLDALKQLVAAATASDDRALRHVRASALFSQLKALNRAANGAARQSKDETTASRQDMDQSHLGLQNLQFEKRHLQREIEKCLQFASVYQDIPLHSLEDFKVLAPDAAKSPEVLENEHQLMLNRLSFEWAERLRLEARKKELIAAKEELLKGTKAKNVTIDSVKTQLAHLLQTAADTQKKVDELVKATVSPKEDVAMSG